MSEPALSDLLPSATGGLADPGDYAASIVARSRSSFTFGMKILERSRREAMYAVYAFARTIDDIADGDWPAEEKRRLLDAWREEIEKLYAGMPLGAISRALMAPVEKFDLPKNEFILMIEGMEMDANGPIQAPTLDTLLAYIRRVAGTAGILSVRVFGSGDDPRADEFALDLAEAFQLTNILRDIEEDAEIDRLYLPTEMLERHEVAHGTPLEAAYDGNLSKVCADIGARARNDFTLARQKLRELDHKAMRPALMMMGVYEGYLDRMENAAWNRSVIPLKMSKSSKLFRGLYYAFFKNFR